MHGIDLGVIVQVVTLISYVGGAILFILMIRADMRILRHDLKGVQQDVVAFATAMEQVTNILRTMAEQKVELAYLRRDVDELRHGEGFVFPLAQSKPTQKG